jgi:hypothetical protein
MESAPKDRRFVAAEFWDGQPKYTRIYEWEGPPDFWKETSGCTCIRPEYSGRYLWTNSPHPRQEATSHEHDRPASLPNQLGRPFLFEGP